MAWKKLCTAAKLSGAATMHEWARKALIESAEREIQRAEREAGKEKVARP